VRRIGNEFAFHSTDPHSADWAGKWNIGNAQRSGCAVHGQNVGIILTVGAEQNRDDLRVVKVSLWKERP
jgi:hypothetical protein